ncbi:hypothetical protein HQ590_08920, partial [bacterium]|nr:hypothetical protein [bacterium]
MALTVPVAAQDLAGHLYAFSFPDHPEIRADVSPRITRGWHAPGETREPVTVETYSFYGCAPGRSVGLVLSPFPGVQSDKALAEIGEGMARRFEAEVRSRPGVTILRRSTEPVTCGPFSGRQWQFVMDEGFGGEEIECVLLLWDGQEAWEAWIDGSARGNVAIAHRILERAEKGRGSRWRVESSASSSGMRRWEEQLLASVQEEVEEESV